MKPADGPTPILLPNAPTTQASQINLSDVPAALTPQQSWAIAPTRVLVVDDDRDLCNLLGESLKDLGAEAICAYSGEIALSVIEQQAFDVVVADFQMSGIDGLELCRRIHGIRAELPVILMTGFGTLETAVGAMRSGVCDFVKKPFSMDEVAESVMRAAAQSSINRELQRSRQGQSEVPHGIIGSSEAIRSVLDLIDRVSGSEATVLITGESGTGKELIAQAIHETSRRAGGPMIAINCAAMPESLLESELFGHAKGAFTDAHEKREGLFHRAHGGTLFLDEIGEMPIGMQVKLLRALQERTVRPVGSSTEVPFDTRIVVATNRNLEAEVAAGRFREDLYYRINVVRVALPPLRSRGADVLLLAQYFVEEFAALNHKNVVGISQGAAAKLLEHNWPGNVRELQNCIERAVAVAAFDHLTPDDLPIGKKKEEVIVRPTKDDLVSLDEVERRHVLRVLDAAGGNKTAAAKILGFDRKTLYRKLERYEVEARFASQKESQMERAS